MAGTERTRVFIKVSGDEYNNPKFIEWLHELDSRNCWVVICVGGGTQINEAFDKAGFDTGEFGPLGREAQSFEERQLARDVLEKNQVELQNLVSKAGLHSIVEIPVIISGTVLCHVNGDQMIRTVYNGFDELYVVTQYGRHWVKEGDFEGLPKVKIKVFDTAPSV